MGWPDVVIVGDSESPLRCCHGALLPLNELTETGGDMRTTHVSGELEAPHHAFLWLFSIPEEEYRGLTSIVILTDCPWAFRALTKRNRAYFPSELSSRSVLP